MEQNFQTSFIPKKSMIEQRVVVKRPVGILLVISIIIFLTMVVVSGGVYFYKGVLTQSLTKMEGDLNLVKNSFEPSKISQLKLLDIRLSDSNDILSKHITVSPIFKALEAITLKTIRYTNFSYDSGSNTIMVKLTGQAVGYRSIALQADLFTKNKNIIDPVFSNLSLDDKGNVLFNLDFSVDSSFVNYKQVLKKASEDSSGVSTITDPGTLN